MRGVALLEQAFERLIVAALFRQHFPEVGPGAGGRAERDGIPEVSLRGAQLASEVVRVAAVVDDGRVAGLQEEGLVVMPFRRGVLAAAIREDAEAVVRAPAARVAAHRGLEQAFGDVVLLRFDIEEPEPLAGADVASVAFEPELECLFGQGAIAEFFMDRGDLEEGLRRFGVIGERLDVEVDREVEVALAPGVVAAREALGSRLDRKLGGMHDRRLAGVELPSRGLVAAGFDCARGQVRLAGAAGQQREAQGAGASGSSFGNSPDQGHRCILRQFVTFSPRNRNTSAMRTTAGPIATTKKDGNRQNTSGKINLVPIFAASSSARCMRLSRNSSA